MAAVDTRDGRVAIIDNGRTYLYDLSSRSIVGHLAGTNASYLAFAGDRLLVQRSDGNVEIWDQRGAALERTLPADQSYAGFYPVTDAGGHLVARQRSDGSTTIADLDSGATLATLPAPASPQLGLKIGSAFGPDGQHLVTVLETLTTNGSWIIQYDLRPATLVRAACSAAGRNLTAADWRAYVGSTSPSDLSCRRAQPAPQAVVVELRFVAEDVLCQPPFVSDAVVVSSGDGEVRSPETGVGHSLGGGVVHDAGRTFKGRFVLIVIPRSGQRSL